MIKENTMNDQKRNAVLCPNCNRLVSRDEPRCPHCGISNPGAWWKQHAIIKGFGDMQWHIHAIIGVNIAMYLISLIIYPRESGFQFNPLTMFSPSNQNLLLLGATGTVPIDRLHRWWSLLTANYLHGGIFHLLFNMVAFRQIVPLIVQEYGVSRMVVMYHVCGVMGYVVSYLAGIPFTIGASAAICGLIGSAMYYGQSRGGVYGKMIVRQIGGWAISILVLGFLMPGINNWGHVGGFVSGGISGFILGYNDKRKELLNHKILAAVCLIVTFVTLVWAVFQALMYRMMG